jgi:hypothetical protein
MCSTNKHDSTNLFQSQIFAITMNDNGIGLGFQLFLDETQQMLLIHCGRMMNVRVDLAVI